HGADVNQLSTYNSYSFDYAHDSDYSLNERGIKDIDFQSWDYTGTLKNNEKYTPLMIARKPEIMELLFKYGADPFVKNGRGENALMVQVQYQYDREGTKHFLLALTNHNYMRGYGYK